MQTGWHRADIRAAVEKAGTTVTQLARDNGLQSEACRHALRHRHIPGEKVIAAYIGVPLWELWPDRWQKPARKGAEPVRVRNQVRTNPNRKTTICRVQARKVA